MELYNIKSQDIQSYIKTHGRLDVSKIKKEIRQSALMQGCVIGDINLVRDCINLGEDLSDPWFIENSSYYGYYEIVKLLLENGVSPFGHGSAMYLCYCRNHKKTYNLLNLYARRYKLNKILKR